MSYCFKITILAEKCIKMRHLLMKIARSPQTSVNLSPSLEKSWLRHRLSLCPKFLTPFPSPFLAKLNLAYLVYVVAYAQAST